MLRALPLLLLTACLTAVPQRQEIVLQEAQPDEIYRSGALGDDGPLAVARAQLDVQSRVVDSFLIHVFFAWNTGSPDTQSDDTLYPSSLPLLVLLQERGVGVERYFWLAQHFASRGYPTVVVDHFADAPLIEADNGALALEDIRRVSRLNGSLKGLIPEDAKGVIIGHGEGGRAAQDLWVRYPADFEKLLVIGGVLDPALTRAGGEALCIGGGNDKRTDAMRRVCGTFSQALTATLTTGNHFMFADDLLAVESAGDGKLGDGNGAADDSLDGQRRLALHVMDTWLDHSLGGDAEATAAIDNCREISRCEGTPGCATNAVCAFSYVTVAP